MDAITYTYTELSVILSPYRPWHLIPLTSPTVVMLWHTLQFSLD